MRLTLLTIDDPTRDDRDYILCQTEKTEPELEEIIKGYLEDDPDLAAYEIMEMLEESNNIVDKTSEFNNYWIELRR